MVVDAVLIPGDDSGPELVAAARRVLDAATGDVPGRADHDDPHRSPPPPRGYPAARPGDDRALLGRLRVGRLRTTPAPAPAPAG
ncbi:MAG: hypothetical protein ACJ73E_05125 [Mycobacteriales bacterium]